ncbi:outer membrane protein assembly factor BamD [Porphyromonas levii]|uniref:Outer membrane protein assembly factor BamD n=1 Tax=Porphyromonas levii TaxID=28114 RepID=A0A4Y8WNA6_9PORP|nr:outer membrane protein assembly factor BamD [Porphyromonas levii]MBR8704138.1 Outer membrane protein assembly factor BamD [Porphyromonas levii]MBR8774816.1 Outer membrane protein assembly factor BamD [Porphyromonas levii]MBR8785641.1 Outer membrane protein assembly factor BamD [Porphyromonas levii]MBR8803554.1 Outer membrane protein assembly factor BamD [Porphyromonas levii]MBR8807608.1 Outer membrane protein assembly factor BamD [Porphyromonas levii]
MKQIIKASIVGLFVLLFATSCNELAKVQKSTDLYEKYSYAKKFYNTGKYAWAAQTLEEILPYFRGSSEMEPALYLKAQSYYKMKDYQQAQLAFKQYYTDFPNGEYTELARFYSGYGLAQDIPDPRLDQSKTMSAMHELQQFIDFYPQSEKAEEAKQLLFTLQENLALKEVLNAKLYYDLGNYIFNNYESCIITARNAMKTYPYSIHKEEMHYYVVASLYEIAKNSVQEKKQQRLRDLRDEYYNFINEFPDGKRRKDVDKFFAYAEKNIDPNAGWY